MRQCQESSSGLIPAWHPRESLWSHHPLSVEPFENKSEINGNHLMAKSEICGQAFINSHWLKLSNQSNYIVMNMAKSSNQLMAKSEIAENHAEPCLFEGYVQANNPIPGLRPWNWWFCPRPSRKKTIQGWWLEPCHTTPMIGSTVEIPWVSKEFIPDLVSTWCSSHEIQCLMVSNYPKVWPPNMSTPNELAYHQNNCPKYYKHWHSP